VWLLFCVVVIMLRQTYDTLSPQTSFDKKKRNICVQFVINFLPSALAFSIYNKPLFFSPVNPNPNDIDRSLNEAAADKIRKYHGDYNNNPPNDISFMPGMDSTSCRLHSEFIRLLFLQSHRETDHFSTVSGVQSAQSNLGSSYFHFRRVVFSSILKLKCGNILVKTAVLRINLNLDGTPITSQSHTHPSHSQTSRLLTSSLSLGVPVPRSTQCM
jgi:hypothetical protein